MITKALNLLFFLLFYAFQGTISSFGEVQRLTQDNFDTCIASNPYVLVLFKDLEVCSDCEEALDKIEKVSQPEMLNGNMIKRYVSDDTIAKKYGASDYPAVVFFRHRVPAIYDGKSPITEAGEFEEWLELVIQDGTKTLTDDTFEHLTQAATGATTGDWFVVFYTPSCDTCQRHFPVIETVALRKKQTMNFATVDIEVNKKLVERFKIETHLKGILFRKGKMYEYEPAKFDSASLISFVEYWHKNVQARPVPVERTSFDRLTDSIALNLKESINDPSKRWMVIAGAVMVVIIVVAIIVQIFRKPDEVGGLEVKNPNGDFVPADPIPGTVVVTPSAILQRWTGDIIRGAEHRILIKDEERSRNVRQAVIFFVEPDADYEIRCIGGSEKYPPILFKDYWNTRASDSMKYASPEHETL